MLLGALGITSPVISQAASIGNQGIYFTNTISATAKEFPTGGLAGTNNLSADNAAVKAALSSASAVSGVVYLKSGTFLLTDIDVPSNVRIEVDASVTLKLDPSSKNIFRIGKNATTANKTAPKTINVEITSRAANTKFTVDLTAVAANQTAVAMNLGYVENFALSNFTVKTYYTINPPVTMYPDVNTTTEPGATSPGVYNPLYGRTPKKGVVQNVTGGTFHTGYGLVQVFGGDTLLLKNLDGTGGITVRLEPGNGVGPIDKAGPNYSAITNIKMDNIIVRNGFAALWMNPHSKDNKNITASNLKGFNSGFTVIAEKSSTPLTSEYLRGGFENVTLSGTISNTGTSTRNADVGFVATLYAGPVTDGLRDIANKSGDRWYVIKPIGAFVMGSRLSATAAGDQGTGGYWPITVKSGTSILFNGATDRIRYRSEAVTYGTNTRPSNYEL